MSIAEIAFANEVHLHGGLAIENALEQIWTSMQNCIDAGLQTRGVLSPSIQAFTRSLTRLL